MNFTEDQQKAIDVKNKQVLLSAAAGSGKTAVVIEHIFSLITDKELEVSVDNLLVLSFTNKASKEMKDRLERRLNKAIMETESEEDLFLLTEQINLLKYAQISTIHNFCKTIIKQNFHAVDIDPSFNLANEEQINLLKEEALLELMEYWYEKKEDRFFELIEIFGNKVIDEGFLKIVMELYEFSMSTPFPEKWLLEVVSIYDIFNKDVSDIEFIKILKDNIVSKYVEMIAITDSLIEKLSYDVSLIPLKDDLSEKRERLVFIRDAIINDIENAYITVDMYKNDKPVILRGKDINKDLYKSVRDAYIDEIESGRAKIEETYFYKPFSDYLKDMAKQKPIVEMLVQIVLDFDKIYSAKKRKANLLDFNDLEQLAIKILVDEDNNPSDIALSYQKKFYEIIIDEFQDTNYVQETILNALLNKNNPYKNKYMVGDVKQSIYKFRKANPQIFIDNYNLFSKNNDENNILINLSKNFRSRKGIIDGVNYIFEKIMTEDFGGIVYNEDVKLHLGRQQLSDKDDYMTFLLLEEKEKSENDEVDDEVENMSSIMEEAIIISNKIDEIVNGDKPLFVEENGQMRKVCYKDITILLRSFSNIDVITGELTKLKIPSVALNQSDYFYQIEVKTMIALLSIIDNRTLDIKVVSVLTSPIYNFLPEELLEIRLLYKDMPFYYMIEEYVNSFDNELSNKLKSFILDIERWQKINNEKPISDLIWTIFNDTNFLNLVLVSEKGEKGYLDLMILLEKAIEYENNSKSGLFSFLRYVEKSAKSKIKIQSAQSKSEIDAVNIMTIHKSKGLEFKVVFQSITGKKLNSVDEKRDFVMHETLGFSYKHLDTDLSVRTDTLLRRAIIEDIKANRLHEEARLLYVSLTRAEDKLYITGRPKYTKSAKERYKNILKSKETDILKYIKNADNYFDFLLPVLLKHKDFAPFREYLEIDSVYIEDSEVKFEVVMVNANNILEKDDDMIGENLQNNLDTIDIDKIDMSSLYVSKEIAKIPSNITIEEIKAIKLNKERSNIVNIRKPDFLLSDEHKTFSNAEKGTLLHKFLEHINLKMENNLDTLQSLKNELIEKDIFNVEEAETINLQKIITFLNSDLAKRIIKSDCVKREKAFAFYIDASEIYSDATDEKLLLHGVIDLYFYEDDYIVLVDYKSDYTTDENIDDLKQSYALQLSIYKRAILIAENKEVKESYVYSFFRDEIIKL